MPPSAATQLHPWYTRCSVASRAVCAAPDHRHDGWEERLAAQERWGRWCFLDRPRRAPPPAPGPARPEHEAGARLLRDLDMIPPHSGRACAEVGRVVAQPEMLSERLRLRGANPPQPVKRADLSQVRRTGHSVRLCRSEPCASEYSLRRENVPSLVPCSCLDRPLRGASHGAGRVFSARRLSRPPENRDARHFRKRYRTERPCRTSISLTTGTLAGSTYRHR